jgi:hypothetical protein
VLQVLREALSGVTLKTRLRIPEHQLLEKSFGINFLQISQDRLLLGKGYVHEMLFEIPCQLKIKLTLIPVQVYHNNFGKVVTVLHVLHECSGFDWHCVPVEVLLLLEVFFLERRVHCCEEWVNHVC